jgi:hypothetical protein
VPCNSDYMNPRESEINMSRVLCHLAELEGKPFEKHWLEGYHPKAYNKNIVKTDLDQAVKKLCSKLRSTKDVSKYSLELQLWSRDHSIADKERLKAAVVAKLARRTLLLDKAALLKRLSPYERSLLK